MNREIKFRGKRLDTGEWMYGYFVSGNYEPRLKNYTKAWIMHFGRLQGALKKQEVDPKTVGQYTGLKDKNGVEVYEGNIVCYFDGIIAVVCWNQRLARFDTGELGYEEPYIIEPDMFEVIGNIHDNPELLK